MTSAYTSCAVSASQLHQLIRSALPHLTPTQAAVCSAKYSRARTHVTTHRRVTERELMRVLSCGYGTALNIVRALEVFGVVSAPDGDGRRSVLVQE